MTDEQPPPSKWRLPRIGVRDLPTIALVIGAAIALWGYGYSLSDRLGVRPIFNPEFRDLTIKVSQLEKSWLLQRWNELMTKLKVNGYLDAADQAELCEVARQLSFAAPGCQ